MIWLYLVSFIILSGGIVLLLGLTPEIVTDDLMGIFVPKQNLRDKILIAQGKKKSRKLTKEILHIKDALDATGKANQFTAACAASVVLMIVGCTGLRPGEKLYEEKLMAEEGLKKTPNNLIHIGSPIPFATDEFLGQLEELTATAYRNDEEGIRKLVEKIVTTYKPAADL